MLSGETANGKHPSLVVTTMGAIVATAELAVDYQEQFHAIRWAGDALHWVKHSAAPSPQGCARGPADAAVVPLWLSY